MTVPHRAHRHAPTRRSAIRWTGVLAFAAATGGAPLAAQDDIAAGALAASRTAAGTAWQPELTPKPGLHGSWGGWSLMGHGALSLGYVREESPKGGAQLGSTNWVMLSATRRAGTGVLALTLMGSVETLTLGDCGQPRLLAVSGTCPTDGYSDYQHPHPPVMELSARYVEPLGETSGIELFGGLAGQPALGPPGRVHRPSASADPASPIAEHDLDPAHVSGGVLTAGVFSGPWKVEASVFNGEAPDPERVLSLGPLTSWSARATFNPNAHWSIQTSAARIATEGGGHHAGAGSALRVATVTALHHRQVTANALSATTLGYAYMDDGTLPRHTVLLESTLAIGERHTFFARAEAAERAIQRLVITDPDAVEHDHSVEAFANTVAQVSAGYALSARLGRALLGVGARGSISFLSRELGNVYQQRRPIGGAVFVSLRPASTASGHRHTDS